MISTLVAFINWYQGLEVGPGKQFERIESAVSAAKPGDTILVYPDPHGYPKTAIRVRTASITIQGVGKKPVRIDGDGFEYSGAGATPRSIFQFDPESSGSSLRNLELVGAHNGSFNGAGVRIQAANKISISDCIIRDNDMGVMSNGKEGDSAAGSDQWIEYCLIDQNGNQKDPGYNHNLYLGGTSVMLSHCEIRNSITGHNVKSRAHFIQIQGCFIHDAANREIDLPEAWDTSRPNSNAVLIGNRIVKDPKCSGNRGVIHFGAEKGTRNGTLYLFSNTIVTPFLSPIVSITVPKSSIVAQLNLFLNTEQGRASLWESSSKDMAISATDNSLSPCYGRLEGNSTLISKSETLGRFAPLYLDQGRSGTGIVPNLQWLDGNGVTQKLDGPRDDLSRNVGPRAIY
jgi:hypothetical protein